MCCLGFSYCKTVVQVILCIVTNNVKQGFQVGIPKMTENLSFHKEVIAKKGLTSISQCCSSLPLCVMESVFDVPQFKIFTHLMVNFSDSRSLISLINNFHVRFSSVWYSNRLFPHKTNRGFTVYLWQAHNLITSFQ